MNPVFAARTGWNLVDNPLTALISEARESGRTLCDLTESNPTRVGLSPGADLIARLGDARGALYEPLALGHPEAREAIAGYYREHGVEAVPHIVLSASTSESYGWCFKLLAERGDSVLVPQPSYPLFDYLAALEDVRLVRYPLMREAGFRIDLDAIRSGIDARTRAVLLVHPNNPTGSFVRRDDAAALEELCAAHGLSLIVDEVFVDYAFDGLQNDRLPTFAGERRCLTFVLSGISKVCALPQLKLGWMAVFGPDAIVRDAMARLEVIADTYLSVSTPVARALPEILAARHGVQRTIRARTAANLRTLDAQLPNDSAIRRLPCDGGWYAILEVPRTQDEDAWVATLLREEGIIVHPGYFFDLDREGYLVVSLLPEEAAFSTAIARVVRRLLA